MAAKAAITAAALRDFFEGVEALVPDNVNLFVQPSDLTRHWTMVACYNDSWVMLDIPDLSITQRDAPGRYAAAITEFCRRLDGANVVPIKPEINVIPILGREMEQHDLPVDEILERAKTWGMSQCVVVGRRPSGKIKFGGTITDSDKITYLLMRALWYMERSEAEQAAAIEIEDPD